MRTKGSLLLIAQFIKMKKICVFLIFIPLFIFAEQTSGKAPKREFRAMWIATVNNIDWPSKPGLPVEKQKDELLEILNSLEALHFNAVIFQVRPAGDAFYRSATEPWSHWLTGTQGKAPQKGWDPLIFIIDECHKRGMELHAWMNPFRLSQNLTTPYAPGNIARRHPEWVLTYGNKQYLDPGIPAVRTYLNNVVSELIRKYDVDAIHFDDYFYPYPIAGQAFPDTLSFQHHKRNYTETQVEEWRRNNVDLIIESLHTTIKSIKPGVKFGISPFGVWKNYNEDDEIGGSATTAGTTNYDNLYADVINWQRKGWIDYLIPQIYWEIGHSAVDYITLANWWSERSFGRHVYVGHALYKLIDGRGDAWKNPQELPEQILIARSNNNIQGSAFFRMDYLKRNPHQIQKRLSADVYTHKALLPTMPWLDKRLPAQPTKVKLKGFFRKDEIKVKYKRTDVKSPDHLGYAIYMSETDEQVDVSDTENLVHFTQNDIIDLNNISFSEKGKIYLWLSILDKHHNETAPIGPLKFKVK